MTLANACAPTGTITTQEDIFIEGGPEFWFGGVPKYNPDSDGFYWGITGTANTPAYKVGCYEDFRFRDNITMNDVSCDQIGVKQTIQKRNFVDVTFTLKSLLPFTVLTHLLKGGAVTQNATEGTEKFGLGEIDNTIFHMCFWSRIYNSDGDCINWTGHRCQFVDAWELATPWGQPWTVSNIIMRCFADDAKPDAQQFGTMIRYDPSVIH